jgi:hypothetical protein
MLLFGAMKAQAALTVRSADGGPTCRFEDNGDLYLGGLLAEFGGNTIPSPPAGSYSWRILDSSGNTILLLFKSTATLNSVTYYPGDMFVKGTVSARSTPPLAEEAYVWRLKNATGTVVALVNNSGNLLLLCETGQTVSDKVKTYASFPLTTSIASGKFEYGPSDLDFMANKGDAYTVWDTNTNPPNDRPTEEYDPEVTDYPYWYDEKESWHGCGDLWVTTWVANDPSSGTPVLLMANGDGYGLSYRRYVGAGIATYQEQTNPSGITYYPFGNYTNRGWEAQPVVAISEFHGRPGDGHGTDSGYLGWPIGSPDGGPGKTIARFLRSYDPVLPSGELDSPNYSTRPIPKNPDTGQYPTYYYKETNPHIDSHSYRTPRELKPTGLIHFPNGDNGTTYLACQDHNPNHPDDGNNSNSGFWEPTAAAQHVYIFKSTDQGLNWTPTESDGTDYLPRLDLDESNRTWTDYLFTTPAFCQFGMAYGDYGDAFPTEAATTKYLYAFSPHERWWNQDSLYLARAKVYDSTSGGWQTDNIRDATKWYYWVGTDSTGQPVWASSDATKAAPILHAKGEIAHPSVIYHKDSGLYLMATFSNSGNTTLDGWPNENIFWNAESGVPGAEKTVPVGGRVDPHWILWQAPKPWGPWKKVFTNDYNGLQTDYLKEDDNPDHTMDRMGFFGYNVQIMPSWTSTSGTGEWSVWVLHAGFRNFFEILNPLEFDVGGRRVYVEHPQKAMKDWLTGYTLEFSQLTLSQKAKAISASLSPMYQHEQNNTPVVPASAVTVGYHFQLSEARTVTHLGRYFVTGNSGTHTLKIASVRVIGTTADQPTYVASKTLNLGTGGFTPDQMDENGFVYVKLDSPVQLSVNTHYLLLSSEGGACTDAVFGGPSKWANGVYQVTPPPTATYDFEDVEDLPEVATGRVLQILDAAWPAGQQDTWTLYNDTYYPANFYGLCGNSFGSVNLLFQRDSTVPWAMHSTTGQTAVLGPACERLAGTRFSMTADVIVSALGRLKVANNTKVHEVRLMLEELEGQTYTYTTIASIPIRMYPGTANGAYVYRDLATPVRLLSGKTYVLVSREFYNVGENYCDKYSMEDSLGSEFDEAAAFWVEWTSNGVGDRHVEDDEKCYAGVNLKYY